MGQWKTVLLKLKRWSMDDNNKSSDEFLSTLFDHILLISKGECHITDETLDQVADPMKLQVFAGLKLLHEDLELYKTDFEAKMESDYELRILKKKNQNLEQFNSMASHDLKEPLRTMIGYTGLLQKKYSQLLDDKGQMYLNFVQESATRMSDLVDALLNYSKVFESDSMENIDSNNVLKEVIQDLNQLVKEARATITYEQLPNIKANNLALRMLFTNLLSNALKFRSSDRTSEIHVTCESNMAGSTFCIKDNGIGIEEEYKEKIFTLFQRLHTREEIEGTGIGLSTCQKIVGLHKGKMWLESEYGKGSSFYFYLPTEME